MTRLLPFLFAALLWVGPSYAQQATEADNTKRNASGPNHRADTAEQQSNAKDDLALTQAALVALANGLTLNFLILFIERRAPAFYPPLG